LSCFAGPRCRFESSRIPVTTSIGIAAVPDHATSVENLIRCADQALYRAKSTGRNRAVAFNEA
jgi:diguanylate cyclase (GGDEF)-like protein